MDYCELDEDARDEVRREAFEISRIALWENLISHYWKTFDQALDSASGKESVYYEKERIEKLPETEQVLVDIQPHWRRVLVQQHIPDKLKPLEDFVTEPLVVLEPGSHRTVCLH